MRPLAALVVLASFVLALVMPVAAVADAPPPSRSPDEALRALVAGNKAFVAAGASCARQSPARRGEVAAAQHPIAVVVGCADSRVPPEAIFGQGIGDLFIVRVAGNVVDDTVLGSVEYAVEHLGVSLVVVLGHERCGAVEAALGTAAPHAHVGTIVRRIRAAIAAVRSRPGDALDNAVRANVAASVNEVRSSKPLLAPAVQKGDVKVVGGRYDLDTGVVEILP
jgi:carbonic anhydrase